MSDKPGTFQKGDPRINRNGRPKTFTGFRDLAIEIASEVATNKGEPIVIDGHKVTVTEAILRSWAQSKDPRLVQAFIQYAYGKPPETVEISGKDGQPITIRNFDYGNAITTIAAGSDDDSGASGES